MPESTLSIKGQTTLPAEVRRALGLNPGDRLRYVILDGGEVRLVKTRAALGLAGMLKREGPAVSLEAMEAAAGQGAQE